MVWTLRKVVVKKMRMGLTPMLSPSVLLFNLSALALALALALACMSLWEVLRKEKARFVLERARQNQK
jgi:hypothetical protein